MIFDWNVTKHLFEAKWDPTGKTLAACTVFLTKIKWVAVKV